MWICCTSSSWSCVCVTRVQSGQKGKGIAAMCVFHPALSLAWSIRLLKEECAGQNLNILKIERVVWVSIFVDFGRKVTKSTVKNFEKFKKCKSQSHNSRTSPLIYTLIVYAVCKENEFVMTNLQERIRKLVTKKIQGTIRSTITKTF